MKTSGALLLFCLASDANATAATLTVCFKNEISVTDDTIRHTETGLKTHEKDLAVVFRFSCEPESEETVVITLRDVPSANQLPDALGAARVRNGKILPQIEIFCNPVRRMVRSRRPLSPTLEGWALAKVAAHEIHHYLRKQLDHKHGRLNQEFLTPELLIEGFSKMPGTRPALAAR